jgi:hypothetical protein
MGKMLERRKMEVPRRTKIYKVVTAETSEKLEKKVNNLLLNGWELVGGISVSVVTHWHENDLTQTYVGEYYIQAMSTTL